MIQPTLNLAAAADHSLVAVEAATQRTIEWIVSAPTETQRPSRAPLNLALVLDRSGSMQGDKLTYVQQAACHLLDLLDSRDRVAIVAYDDQIQVLSRSEPMTEANRQSIKRRINDLKPGGWTDLSGGWLQGCQEITAFQQAEGINRALLLTDGLANKGITDIEALIHHARELRRRGISTSTFGVGLDFNEQLLQALAEQGGGHFFYIERPQQIPNVFRQELGELLTIVAREAFLSIPVPSGARIDLLGDLPHERTATGLRVFLGEVGAGERRLFYTRVLTPLGTPGSKLVIRGELGYATLDGRTEVVQAEANFTYAWEQEIQRIAVNSELLSRVSEVELAAATTRALQLEREGQRAEAQAVMQRSIAANAPYMPAPAAAAANALTDQMAGGLSEEQRKSNHFAAYRKRQSRE